MWDRSASSSWNCHHPWPHELRPFPRLFPIRFTWFVFVYFFFEKLIPCLFSKISRPPFTLRDESQFPPSYFNGPRQLAIRIAYGLTELSIDENRLVSRLPSGEELPSYSLDIEYVQEDTASLSHQSAADWLSIPLSTGGRWQINKRSPLHFKATRFQFKLLLTFAVSLCQKT